MKKTKIPDYRGSLDPSRQKSSKPLPNQLTLFDKADYVPAKKTRRRSG